MVNGYDRLREIIAGIDSCVVAFSGGVDSTLIAKVAYDTLGEKVIAVTATSPTYPLFELQEARSRAREIGVRHLVIESDELKIPGFSKNDTNRCYFCKKELFTKLKGLAVDMGCKDVLDGTNKDDLSDFRPGREAAREWGVRSPLLEAGLTKDDIRSISRTLGIENWDKPAYACLSSRFPYGMEIDQSGLEQVSGAEDFMRSLGFKLFRVRHHKDTARIEIGTDEFHLMFDRAISELIVKRFKELGYHFVVLDLEGYRRGSLNSIVYAD